MVSLRLRELSDLEGEVDAYIAAVEAGGRPENLAGDVAERLMAHHRPAQALAWLDRAPVRHEGHVLSQRRWSRPGSAGVGSCVFEAGFRRRAASPGQSARPRVGSKLHLDHLTRA